MQATSSTPADVAAGKVPDCVSALIAAIDGMGVVMNIHAQWMLGITDKTTRRAESGIPKDYKTDVGCHSRHRSDVVACSHWWDVS